MKNPVCPHCDQDINFSKALRISNPFYFKCPLCKLRLKQFSIVLLIIFILTIASSILNALWVYYEIMYEGSLGILVSIGVFLVRLLALEFITYRYFANYGITKNNDT